MPALEIAVRPILAALANTETRAAFARVVLGQLPAEPAPREKRALSQLESAGLIAAGGDGWTADEEHLRALLLQGAVPQPKAGPERFLDQDGRIERMPPHGEGEEFLRLLAPRVVDDAEALSEPDLNARLAALTDDVPLLRRMLVDCGILVRDPAGTAYRRAVGAS
ncbi:DUF2087 domain-containing protein [Microbacterium sp. KUDC0406]|uniref:DUF2087 domain-containing protein n=1 Tax=Microbacterium sp. KUDC0406 TaxID=2909588 RepID=UPI001F3D6467|nr:DUF2087 domain-containing protein [Microbacterium sp. KUDC0406]UJP08718.1 DUF2087 domain-containing protein [Microbacterium sp. KUDC0406]